MRQSPENDLSTRRSWLGKAGLGVVAAAAGLLGRRSGAQASHGPAHMYHCCALANGHSGPSCASGTSYSWTCCDCQRIYRCYECWDTAYPQPSSCWQGYFYKSYGVQLSTTCSAC